VYWLAEAKHALRRVQRNRAESALSEADTVLATMPNATFLAAMARGLRTELTESASADPGLTDRELMILRGLADGESRREVAERSYLSLNTIKTHLRTAYRKLGATSREEAIERARTLGLLSSPGGDERPPLR
jgi:LuxR family maltose regulon positive regulatory protein